MMSESFETLRACFVFLFNEEKDVFKTVDFFRNRFCLNRESICKNCIRSLYMYECKQYRVSPAFLGRDGSLVREEFVDISKQ